MPRPFNVRVDSAADIGQIHAALGTEAYWLARLATLSGHASLESLTVDDDQAVQVVTTQDLGRDLLPGIVAKVYRRDIKIRHAETWVRTGETLKGEMTVTVQGAPGSGSGAATVTATDGGSSMAFDGTVEFKVPLVGGAVESFIAREFANGIPDIQAFTANWIVENS